jgi:hypothetical protein
MVNNNLRMNRYTCLENMLREDGSAEDEQAVEQTDILQNESSS